MSGPDALLENPNSPLSEGSDLASVTQCSDTSTSGSDFEVGLETSKFSAMSETEVERHRKDSCGSLIACVNSGVEDKPASDKLEKCPKSLISVWRTVPEPSTDAKLQISGNKAMYVDRKM